MKKLFPLAVALGTGLMALVLASVPTVRAEPADPIFPKCPNCDVFVWKDLNIDGLYDVRVNPLLNGTTLPDANTGISGLWQISGASVSSDDLYVVIRPNFVVETGKILIGGDLWRGTFGVPGAVAYNGIPAALWEDRSVPQGKFGDLGDFRFDRDVTTNTWRSNQGGDYRLFLPNSPFPKAIVLHIDNRVTQITSFFGWVWEQTKWDKLIPVQ